MKNTKLNKAKKCKKDEFYTLYEDIEKELSFYKNLLKNKVVYCNCDTINSNFVKYFINNYKNLSLGGLIFTSIHSKEKYFYDGEWLNHQTMDSYGDFRSPECIELLKEADVVVTNPPFSLFREYVAQLMEYDKKFIIIGNQNAISCKEIFPLMKENKMWLGFGFKGNSGFFESPYKDCAVSSQHKEGMIRVSGVMWFTNLDIEKRHEKFTLYETYTPEKYPKYDNYNAIEVKETKLIPKDYDGVMGVPITFMDKYCPDQFEILGITDRANTSGLRTKKYTVEEAPNANDLNARSVIKENGNYKVIYARILIRNLNPAQSHPQNN